MQNIENCRNCKYKGNRMEARQSPCFFIFTVLYNGIFLTSIVYTAFQLKGKIITGRMW